MTKIGNVILDETCYIGRDLYSDGAIEDTLLEIVKEAEPGQYDSYIKQKQNWAVLYHLSKNRHNIIDWMDDDKSLNVLEIGSGCGAITGKLAEKFNKVTCIELSKKRSLINAYRNRDCSNIEIKIGNYRDVSEKLEEKYDIITLIGVFEYAQGYMSTDNSYVDFLVSIKQHLKPNGVIVIAIENQFGLKYWAGCVEDHKGVPYMGLEGYSKADGVKTFSKGGLEKVIKESGCRVDKFYYPYPDYKLPTVIYSDEYLPKLGELNNNSNNFDSARLLTFDESKVFDTIILEEEFPRYSNSFLVFVKED